MAATLDENLVPSTGALMGCVVTPRAGRSHEQETLYLERSIGRGFDMIRNFHRWDRSIVGSAEKECVAGGRIPITNWAAWRGTEGTAGAAVKWSRIAQGYEDAVIDAQAKAVKAFGHPMFLIFHHEPENDTALLGTPQAYRNAWTRIRQRFNSAGVTNVTYMADYMAWTFDDRSGRNPDDWYPGDNVIDWIAANTFNWYPGRPRSKWQELGFLGLAFHDWATRNHPGKPLAIGASGCQEDPAQPNRKAEWYQHASSQLQEWPEFKGWIYYNSPKIYPWWFDSTAEALEGFSVAVDEHFNPLEKPAPTSIEPTEVFDESDQDPEPDPAEPPDESFDDGE